MRLRLSLLHNSCPQACQGASGAAVGGIQLTAAPGRHEALDRRSRNHLGAQGAAALLAFSLPCVPSSLSCLPARQTGAARGEQQTPKCTPDANRERKERCYLLPSWNETTPDTSLWKPPLLKLLTTHLHGFRQKVCRAVNLGTA